MNQLELGDRVVQAYRLEEISIGWVKPNAYNSRLRSWAEECWRWWWGHVRDTQSKET